MVPNLASLSGMRAKYKIFVSNCDENMSQTFGMEVKGRKIEMFALLFLCPRSLYRVSHSGLASEDL
jgi:hypothetical protein